jgi:hypothetical protein
LNVTRNRRRLVAARRYAARQYLPGQAPTPPWDLVTDVYDSGSVLRAAERLAWRKYRTAMADILRDHCDDGSDCGWGPPCGGCSRCMLEQAMYYSGMDRYRHLAVLAGSWRRYGRIRR